MYDDRPVPPPHAVPPPGTGMPPSPRSSLGLDSRANLGQGADFYHAGASGNGTAASLLTQLQGLALQEAITSRMGQIRPWLTDFFARDQFDVPPGGLSEAQRRLTVNLSHYQSNYLVVALALFLVTLLTHIFLALMVAALTGAGVWVQRLPADYSVAIGGLVFTKRTFLFGICLFGVLMLLLTDAGSAIFWLLGIAALAIGAHAVLHQPSAAALQADFEQP